MQTDPEQSDNAVDVLLLTDDQGLIDAVRRARPAQARLHCSDALDTTPARQYWLDLDAVAPPALPAGIRRVYFHSERAGEPAALPPGVLVRKPVNQMALRVLWASAIEHVVAPLPRYSPAALPGWLLEIHDLDLRVLCQACVGTIGRELKFDRTALYLVDESQRMLTLADSNCDFAIDLSARLTPENDQFLARACDFEILRASGGIAAMCQNHGWRPPLLPAELAAKPSLLLSLRTDGGLVGLLCLLGGDADAPPLETLRGISAFIARGMSHARQFERARTEARVDGLTGLYNYRWLCESLDKEIHRAERYAAALSILVVDLDAFKPLNDSYGHVAGDAVLRHVASRITAVLRQTDSAARIGGDEFVVLLPATDALGAVHAADRVLASIQDNEPLVDSRHIPVCASVGAATLQPGWDAQRLLQEADQAMYLAKRRSQCATRLQTAPQAVGQFIEDANAAK